jgi:hypothetical protein
MSKQTASNSFFDNTGEFIKITESPLKQGEGLSAGRIFLTQVPKSIIAMVDGVGCRHHQDRASGRQGDRPKKLSKKRYSLSVR